MSNIPPIRVGIDERHSDCFDNGMVCDPDRAILYGVVLPNDLPRNRFSPAASAIRFIFNTYARQSFMAGDIARGTGYTTDLVLPVLGRFVDDRLIEMIDSDCPFNVYGDVDTKTGLVTPKPRILYRKIEDEQSEPVPRSVGMIERLGLLDARDDSPTIRWA